MVEILTQEGSQNILQVLFHTKKWVISDFFEKNGLTMFRDTHGIIKIYSA